MGRRTYDVFAAAWPTRPGDALSDRMNAIRKVVVSSTLTKPTWNNTSVVNGDLVDEITRLKQQPGKDIVQYGMGQVSFTLLAHGLFDEIRLWVHPLILGAAGPDASLPNVAHNAVSFDEHQNLVERRRHFELCPAGERQVLSAAVAHWAGLLASPGFMPFGGRRTSAGARGIEANRTPVPLSFRPCGSINCESAFFA
jgi:dihydrofolate reductase